MFLRIVNAFSTTFFSASTVQHRIIAACLVGRVHSHAITVSITTTTNITFGIGYYLVSATNCVEVVVGLVITAAIPCRCIALIDLKR
jgi:hypothetical protein